MITLGVMKAIPSPRHPYAVSIPIGEKKQRITYYVGNWEEIPYYLQQAMDCNEPIAGFFEFAEGDQFAYYLQEESLEITPK